MIRPCALFAPFLPPALTAAHAEALRRDGVCVVDRAVPAETVRALRRRLAAGGRFRKTRQPKAIRSDTVRWVHEDEQELGLELGLVHEDEATAGALASTVRALKGVGAHFEEVLGQALDAPSRCMAAVYAPPASPDEPSGYRPHLDHRPPDDDDLYWTWKSSREQSERVLTAILYLNEEDWSVERDGGQLRVFLECTDKDDTATAAEVRDVAPIGGRLVVFKSREVPHAVLPVTGGKARMALSCWHLLHHPSTTDES
jgi:hypothetical protein